MYMSKFCNLSRITYLLGGWSKLCCWTNQLPNICTSSRHPADLIGCSIHCWCCAAFTTSQECHCCGCWQENR